MKTHHSFFHPIPLREGCSWLLIATLTTSCCTDKLWQSRSANGNITEVHYAEMTERALIEDGFMFTKDDEKQLYFVETSTSKSQMDLATRIVATPVAIVTDGAIWAGFASLNLMGMMGGSPELILPPLHEEEAEGWFAF